MTEFDPTTAALLDAPVVTEEFLAEGTAEAPQRAPAQAVEAALTATLAGDAGALFEPPALAALAALSRPEWARVRARIKRECRDVRVTDLDRAIRGDTDDDDQSPAIVAVQLAREAGELFFDADRRAYASVETRGVRQTWLIDGDGFRDWLSATYYRDTGKGLGDQAMATALNTLRAVALHDGEERPTSIRIGACAAGIAIDLGDDTWRAVLVSAGGWRLVDPEALPVRLYRTQGMAALPTPVTGGNVDFLWKHVNVPEEARPLVLAWKLEALRPSTPFPVLELCGTQGSAKSSTQRRLRALIDPHTVPLRGRPKSAEDVFIAAGAGWLLSYENISGLSPDMQDALCVVATGGGFAARKLYTNAEECVIKAHRPVVLNGISANATRPDLIDRLIHVAMPEITARLTDAEIDAAFERDAPAIFGGLLDLLSATLARLPAVAIDPSRRPRMADFALLGEAMHQARGHAPGEFLRLYGENRTENMTRALDASPLAQAVAALIEAGHEIVSETAKRTYDRLEAFRPERSETPWPQSPKGMMDQLRRYAPALRVLGIEFREHGRGRTGYTLSIRRAIATSFFPAPQKEPNEVHNVHNVHEPSNGAGSGRELGEHEVHAMFTGRSPRELRGPGREHQCERQGDDVHAANPRHDCIRERCELGERQIAVSGAPEKKGFAPSDDVHAANPRHDCIRERCELGERQIAVSGAPEKKGFAPSGDVHAAHPAQHADDDVELF